jgi:NAD(P)-dependent dehydrogenase (short-subunit alcohol dehydrogenase family)
MNDVRDKVAFITGGASGIGLGLAEAFARAGMQVVIGDIEQRAINRALESLRAKSLDADARAVDVTDRDSVQAAATYMENRYGAVHVLCNNAGVVFERKTEDWTDSGWRWVLDVNLLGVVHGVQSFLPIFRRQSGGHIVNTASITGLRAAPGLGQYIASKFALVGLSQSLRDELGPQGIGVSVLCPGMVSSNILNATRNAPPAVQARLAASPLKPESYAPREVEAIRNVTDATVVGDLVLKAVADGTFYILTDLSWADEIEAEAQCLRRDVEWLRRWQASHP